MAKQFLTFLPLAILAFLLCFASCNALYRGNPTKFSQHHQLDALEKELDNSNSKTWCIAKPSTDEIALMDNIRYSCDQDGVDCSAISPIGNCYDPNTVISHASVAMNLYYVAAGKNPWNCYFNNSGLIVVQNPSTGKCIYPS